MLDKLSVFMYIDQSEGEMGTKTAELILEAVKGALPPAKSCRSRRSSPNKRPVPYRNKRRPELLN
jgi:hypothetical protein